jgi:hypothetical protein
MSDHLSPKARIKELESLNEDLYEQGRIFHRDAWTHYWARARAEATAEALRTEIALLRESLSRRDNADLIEQLVRAEARSWRLQRAIELHAERPNRTEHPWDRELYNRAGILTEPIGD